MEEQLQKLRMAPYNSNNLFGDNATRITVAILGLLRESHGVKSLRSAF